MPLRWREESLVLQFLTAGGAVMLAAMLLTGFWITSRIEQAVVGNTASAAALYLESFVSPLSQELAETRTLSEPAVRALDEVLANTAIGERIVSFKIWKEDGLVVYASDPEIVGQQLPPSDELQRAWQGEVSGDFESLDDPESAAEAALDLPLLEVYSPIREVWSGEVIAVAEFYEVATALRDDLASARRTSWLLVAGVFLASGLLLLGIVQAGGRTIDRQKAMLQAQIAESREIASQNRDLRQRAVGAAARATAQTEKHLRRISADLHDGPAQYVALAAMRLDSIVPDTDAGHGEAKAIRDGLRTALAEIRTISRGLSLPDLERLTLAEVVRRALDALHGPAGQEVSLDFDDPADSDIDPSGKICLYRFLQEGLSNAARHAPGAAVRVAVAVADDKLTARLVDQGPGFDPATALAIRPDGGEGLASLRDRAESIGGEFHILTAPGAGTTLVLTLPLRKGTTS